MITLLLRSTGRMKWSDFSCNFQRFFALLYFCYFRLREMSEPDSLYQLSSTALIKNFLKLKQGLYLCPENIIFDVIFKVFQLSKFELLSSELSHFPIFSKLLKNGDKRACLHKMLQATAQLNRNIPEIISQVKVLLFWYCQAQLQLQLQLQLN